MASHLVGQYQISTFTTPVNGASPIDANVVRGNDNTIKSDFNSHDADATIHVQDSTLASRAAAGTAGRKWMSADSSVIRLFFDDGAAWQELSAIGVPVTITSTTSPQLIIQYDTSNYATIGVSSAGAVTLNAVGASSAFGFVDPVSVTSASATAFTVGLNGATNPAFTVDASTALQVAGLKVKGAVTTGTVAIVVTDSGAAANLTINALGTGTIGIGSVSTGVVTITPNTTISGFLVLVGDLYSDQAATTWHLKDTTSNALTVSTATSQYLLVDTRVTSSGRTGFTFAGSVAPSFNSAATAYYQRVAILGGVTTFTNKTNQTTTVATPGNINTVFRTAQMTLDCSDGSGNITIANAADVIVGGAVIATNTGLQTTTITSDFALLIAGPSAVNGAGGAVTTAYGIGIVTPTGAATNVALSAQGGGAVFYTDSTTAFTPVQMGASITPAFQIDGTTVSGATLGIGLWDATASDAPGINFYRSKNATVGSATVVASGDALGAIIWNGAQQTGTPATQNPAAAIQAFVDAVVTSGAGADMPGRLSFWTTPDASGTLTEAFRIDRLQALAMVSGNKFYVDGVAASGDTYFYESAGNTFDLFVGGTNTFRSTATIITATAALTVTSASATSLAVGRLGATTPAFQVDSSTGSQVAGFSITGAVTGGTVALAAIDSGSNASLTFNAKGNGTIGIGTSGTGQINAARGVRTVLIYGMSITALGTTQNSTPTAAQLLTGIVTQTGATGAGTVTLPTGTNMSSGVTGVATGDTFDCLFANLGGTFTLTITGASGMTVRGNAAIPTGKNGYMRFTCTGSNAWDCYVVPSA